MCIVDTNVLCKFIVDGVNKEERFDIDDLVEIDARPQTKINIVVNKDTYEDFGFEAKAYSTNGIDYLHICKKTKKPKSRKKLKKTVDNLD